MTGTAYSERLRREHGEIAARLPAAVVSPARRLAALELAAAAGLPGLRDDQWRYTTLRPVEHATFLPVAAAAAELDAAAALLPEALPDLPRFVFVNGRFAATLSADPAALGGGSMTTLQSGAAAGPAAGAAHSPAVDADARFAWVNQAFATDAARLDVQGELQLEVLYIEVPSAQAGAAYPRLEITLAADARLTLVERHLGGRGSEGLIAAVVEITLGAHARCEHYRVQALDDDAVFMDALLAQVGEGSEYHVLLLQQGAFTARSACHLQLAGRHARLQFSGMSLAGAKRSLDTSIRVEHLARDTTSEQLLRAIANERAQIAFNSRVEVAATAGGADSRQSLKGLIGGAGAEVNLRPQLEINTDEVRASHGATTGALDEATLFYLLSRGLDPGTARMLLEWAFIEDVISRIRIPALRRQVERMTVDHLGNAAELEALL